MGQVRELAKQFQLGAAFRNKKIRAILGLTRSPCCRTEDPRLLLEDTLDVFGVVAARKWPAHASSGWDSLLRPVVGPLRRWDVSANSSPRILPA